MDDLDQELREVLRWAEERIQDGSEPPWAMETYLELKSALKKVIAGRKATITLEDSQQLALLPETDPQPSDYNDSPNIVLLRPDNVRVQMPM